MMSRKKRNEAEHKKIIAEIHEQCKNDPPDEFDYEAAKAAYFAPGGLRDKLQANFERLNGLQQASKVTK